MGGRSLTRAATRDLPSVGRYGAVRGQRCPGHERRRAHRIAGPRSSRFPCTAEIRRCSPTPSAGRWIDTVALHRPRKRVHLDRRSRAPDGAPIKPAVALRAWSPHRGPLARLSIRNCSVARSVARPMMPPSASTSRTTVPLATPPIAGLHDIWPIVSSALVTSAVRAPRARRRPRPPFPRARRR